MKRFRSLIGVSVMCMAVGACGVKKDMDKMMDTTEEMGKTTEEMNNTTKEMAGTTREMGDRMEDAFHGLREGIGEEKMELHFAKMLEASSTGEKVDHALVFFAAMDFQHWQGDHEDNDVRRDQLIYKNVEYFMSKVNNLVDDDLSVGTPLLSMSARNNWKSLGALAVAMSKIHPDQNVRAERLEFNAISFYDILATALTQKDKYENGVEVPGWVEKVLEKEEVAVYLMQLRHNFMKGVILGEMSDYEEGWFDGMLNKIGYAWMGSTINLKDFNKAKVKKWVELLWKARKTQELLEMMGHELEFNSVLNDSFAGVEFVDYLNFPPYGLETVGEYDVSHGPGPARTAPILEQRYITLETFPGVALNTLSPELQGADVHTNFFLRFFDLQSYGQE